jgi:NADH:ubiquinone oxidoreductase subunit K
MPWPDSHTRFRYFSLVSNLFVCLVCFPLALWGLWQRRREMALWVYFALPLGSVVLTAVLFHGDSRFRCPYDFGIFIAACAAVELIWKRRKAAGALAGAAA